MRRRSLVLAAVHATPADASVGHAASHGCMCMHRVDVERLYDLVKVGTPVDIEV